MSKPKHVSPPAALAAKPRSRLWRSSQIRDEEREEKRMAVLLTAAELFLDRGSHRVSMNDIAEQLCITKPALYNYFSSKDEILFECFRQGNAVTVAALDRVEESTESGLSRLQDFIRAYARLIAVDYGSVMIRLEDRELPEAYRNDVRRYKRDIDARVRAIITRGIEDGSIAPCDVRLAAFAVLGALNWIGQWFSGDGTASPDEIAEEFAQRLTMGLATRGS